MTFIDLFSAEADLYASVRPHYPEGLFRFIASIAPSTACAWDCGTGNGQAAGALAEVFTRVCASDPSPQQISNASKYEGVEYSVQPAEATDYPDAAFDAVCVAQALHWFDQPRFFKETLRVIKPKGVFVAWGYSWFTVSPEFDALFRRVVRDIIVNDWAPQNAILWKGYRDIPMPFTPLQVPGFQIEENWTLKQLLGFVRSWSATRRCMDRMGGEFIEEAGRALIKAWGDSENPRKVVMPIHLIVGRLDSTVQSSLMT